MSDFDTHAQQAIDLVDTDRAVTAAANDLIAETEHVLADAAREGLR